MLEPKYRGKTIAENKWVYGGFAWGLDRRGTRCAYIVRPDEYEGITGVKVDEETVGQFTGLKDDEGTGVEIYEGDTVRAHYTAAGIGEGGGVVFDCDEEITGEVYFNGLSLAVRGIRDKNGRWREYTGYSQGEGKSTINDFLNMHDMLTDAVMEMGNIYNDTQEAEVGLTVIGNKWDGLKSEEVSRET